MENRPDPVLVGAANPGPYTGAGNNTWLLDGAAPTLIDAGVGLPEHVQALERALGGRALVRVLVTHDHRDHSSGLPALRTRWPALDARLFEAAPASGLTPLRHNDHVLAGDRTLAVVHTPGHAPDHVCFWDAERRALYAGDMLIAGGSVTIPVRRGGDLRAYLRSLEAIASLRPHRIYPAHGPIIDDPDVRIAEFIERRRRRERDVIACLDAGITDVEGMVRRIYPTLDPALLSAARDTIQAHLNKLRDEGLA